MTAPTPVLRISVSFGGLCFLGALFAWNKSAPPGIADAALSSQSGIALIGMSYFTLKAASILIETNRRTQYYTP